MDAYLKLTTTPSLIPTLPMDASELTRLKRKQVLNRWESTNWDGVFTLPRALHKSSGIQTDRLACRIQIAGSNPVIGCNDNPGAP